MKKILFVIAMEKEALDIVKYLGLLEYSNKSHLQIYKKDNISLIITGIGKQRVAISLTKYLENNEKPEIIINIGYAGSTAAKVGTWVCANKSYNYEWEIPGEEKYEILGIKEKRITTIENENLLSLPCYSAESFVTKTDIKEDVIFDMELNSIYLICSMYDMELISLKKISDNLSMKDYYQNLEMKDVFELTSSLKYIENITK